MSRCALLALSVLIGGTLSLGAPRLASSTDGGGEYGYRNYVQWKQCAGNA